MLSGRDFIVLSDDWNGLPTSTIHLIRRLATRNRVFWFNTVNRMPRLNWKDFAKAARRVRSWAPQLIGTKPGANGRNGRPQPGSPHVVSPVMLPWFKPGIRRLNCLSLQYTYRQLLKKHGITAPILVTTFPSVSDFVRSVNGCIKIYYCVDEWLDYPGVDVSAWRIMERELVDNVDALVATSRKLLAKNRSGRPSLYLPHGVDFGHFNSAVAAHEKIATLEELPHPIVGFFGLVGEWVDLRLVVHLARSFPHATFVLLGTAGQDMSAINGLDNVHWLGPIPYSRLPGYARYFDVGLIPFVKNDLTEAVNPLKLLEYYSLGIPVLSTRLPELDGIDGPIRLASNDAEFCSNLTTILSDSAGKRNNDAIEIARQNTWEHRADEFGSFVESLVLGSRASSKLRTGGKEMVVISRRTATE
jgi:glycosyltransferase involved in cell wall biosynthesis